MDYKDLRQSLGKDLLVEEELLLSFFLAFSRFEYALKRNGYANNNNGIVQPKWDDFASRYKEQIEAIKTQGFVDAKSYLFEHPPKKQTLIEGKLEWKSTQQDSATSDANHLITLVKRVRNNLFHGGKFHEPIDDPARSSQLLKACTTVLLEILEVDQDLKQLFCDTKY